MLPLIHKEIIDNKKWIDDEEMIDIISIAESTPGPISVNTATFVGYRVAGVLGSAFATLGLMIPSLVIIYVISLFFNSFLENEYVAMAFKGINAAVSVLIFSAALKLSKPLRQDNKLYNLIVLLVVLVIALFFDQISSIILIVAGAILGLLYFILLLPRISKQNTKEGE